MTKKKGGDNPRYWPDTQCANPACTLPNRIIPQEVLQHRHRSAEQMRNGPNYCSRMCVVAHMREIGKLREASMKGNTAQAAYKQLHGHVPGIKLRREAAFCNLERANRAKFRITE